MIHNFGLVVIGAHFGVWLKDQINSTKNEQKNIINKIMEDIIAVGDLIKL